MSLISSQVTAVLLVRRARLWSGQTCDFPVDTATQTTWLEDHHPGPLLQTTETVAIAH